MTGEKYPAHYTSRAIQILFLPSHVYLHGMEYYRSLIEKPPFVTYFIGDTGEAAKGAVRGGDNAHILL
jgi:hypothetical protein